MSGSLWTRGGRKKLHFLKCPLEVVCEIKENLSRDNIEVLQKTVLAA